MRSTESKFRLFAFLAGIQIFVILIFAAIARLPLEATNFLFVLVAIFWIAMFLLRMVSRAKVTVVEPIQQPHAAHAALIANRGRQSLLDIGLVGFWGKNTIVPYRTKPMPTSVETIQPFIQINNRRRRQCRIGFEILDDHGNVVFSREIDKTYPKGTHFITPPARLRLGELIPSGMWGLRIRFNEQILALHHFGWHVDEVVSVDGHINADGEVDEEIVDLLVDDYSAPLSLDDLLSAKSDEQAKKG